MLASLAATALDHVEHLEQALAPADDVHEAVTVRDGIPRPVRLAAGRALEYCLAVQFFVHRSHARCGVSSGVCALLNSTAS